MSEDRQFAPVVIPPMLRRYTMVDGVAPSMSNPLGEAAKIIADPNGAYMLFEDHIAIINRKAPENSLEKLADETLEHVAEFFGRCTPDPAFCGFSTQISVDGLGKPATLTITACEMAGDEPLRRLPVSSAANY